MKTKAWKRERIRRKRSRRARHRKRKIALIMTDYQARRRELHRIAPLAQNPFTSNTRRTIHRISPHPHLDLEGNYEETIATLLTIREASRLAHGNLMIDFKQIQTISPAAALLLVAECDRWRLRSVQQFLRVVDIEEWATGVRRRLAGMGFFQILKVRGKLPTVPPADGEDQFLPFLTGRSNPGQPAKELRQSIEGLGRRLTDRQALYDALVEAMENANEHAYKGLPDSKLNNWWISASVNPANNKMTVMVVDHGQGLVKTLPRSALWHAIIDRVRNFSSDEEHLIKAAFDVRAENKSQTGLSNRGKGLRENIRGYVDAHSSEGHLTAIANGAKYHYKKSSNHEFVETSRLKTPFAGTFIQWEIEDYGDPHPQHNDN